MDTTTTFGLRFDQLAEILSVASEEGSKQARGQDGSEIADALDRQLRTVLPDDSLLLNSVLETIGRLGCDMRALAGKSLLDVLLDAKTDLALLNTIKDQTKNIVASSIARKDIAVATAVYYAAIASGLVFHGQKITDNTAAKLKKSFAMLQSKPWIPPEVATLYSRSQSLCDDCKEDA